MHGRHSPGCPPRLHSKHATRRQKGNTNQFHFTDLYQVKTLWDCKFWTFLGYASQCPGSGGGAGDPGEILRSGPGLRRAEAFQKGPHGGNSTEPLQKSHSSGRQPKTSCQQGPSMLSSHPFCIYFLLFTSISTFPKSFLLERLEFSQ